MNKATTYNLPSVVVIGCRLVLLAIPSWSCLPSVLRMVTKEKFKKKMHNLKNPMRRYQVAMSYKGWLIDRKSVV